MTTRGNEHRKMFEYVNGRHIPVRKMVPGVLELTKVETEDTEDRHLFLSGPPNELAKLLL